MQCSVRRLSGSLGRCNLGSAATRSLPVVPVQQSGSRVAHTVARALTSEDKWEIMELCHRFDRAINQLDQASAVSLFLPQAKLHTPRGIMSGTPAILAFFKAVEPMARGNRHLTVDLVVDELPSSPVPGTTAAAQALSYRLLHKAAAPPQLLATGHVEDVVVKTAEGRWLFAERKFLMDPPEATTPASPSCPPLSPTARSGSSTSTTN